MFLLAGLIYFGFAGGSRLPGRSDRSDLPIIETLYFLVSGGAHMLSRPMHMVSGFVV